MSFICEQSTKVKLEMGCKTLYVWELKLQLPLASPENCFLLVVVILFLFVYSFMINKTNSC